MNQVAILAGGFAKRLHPITLELPKSLIPINNTPFIKIQIEALLSSGIKKVVLCLGHMQEKIMEYVASCNFENLEIHYSIEERKLGTGGAILNALNVLDEEFGVLYGDSFLPINFSKVFQVFGNSQKKALMTVFRNQNRHYINNVNFVNNNIINYSKTQSDQGMHHIDYGFLIFKKDVFKLFSNRDNFDLSEVIEMLVKSGEIEGLEMQHRFYEVGSFLGIQQLEKFLKGRD